MDENSKNRIGGRELLSLATFWSAVVFYIGGLIAPLATVSKYFTLKMAYETAIEAGHKGLATDAIEFFMALTDENPVLVNESNTYSVVSGMWALFCANEYFLATVIVLFSIAFPCAKLASLFVLCHGGAERSRDLHFRAHAFLGKWSMLDVFVIALLVVSLKLGDLVNVQIHAGLYFFAASVLLTMVLTHILKKAKS